jgi:SOS response regulatory protein OraA/RecX
VKNKTPLSRSAQVITFLNSQALVDEQDFVAKKTRSAAKKKSTKKNKPIKKTA